MARSSDTIDRLTYSVAETAAALSCSERTIRRRCRDGSLAAVDFGGRLLILAQPLVDQIEAAAGRTPAYLAERVENLAEQLAAENAERRRTNDPASAEYKARAAAHAEVMAEMEIARAAAHPIHGDAGDVLQGRPW